MSETVLPDDLVFHGNGGFYPPFGVITSKDHGPAVVVSTWIMMCLMGLAVIARFGTRHNLGNKDSVAIGIACVSIYFYQLQSLIIGFEKTYFLYLTQILAVVQSVTIHLAAGHGLGRHVKDLNSKEYAYYEKVNEITFKAILRFCSRRFFD